MGWDHGHDLLLTRGAAPHLGVFRRVWGPWLPWWPGKDPRAGRDPAAGGDVAVPDELPAVEGDCLAEGEVSVGDEWAQALLTEQLGLALFA